MNSSQTPNETQDALASLYEMMPPSDLEISREKYVLEGASFEEQEMESKDYSPELKDKPD